MSALAGAVVLVTGANGGIGTEFAPVQTSNAESVLVDLHPTS
jgi:NAD(P)-dependent dehydrogenase (short-subunit alcohol dehydrogenase family)